MAEVGIAAGLLALTVGATALLLMRRQRRLAASLVEPARLLESVLAHTDDHIYMYDREGRYLYASAAGAQAVGLQPSDMIGHHWRELGFPERIMKRFDRHREYVFDTGRPLVDQTSFPTVTGERFYEYSLRPVGPPGDVSAVVATVRDITRHKRAETDLSMALSELRLAPEQGEEAWEMAARIRSALDQGRLVLHSQPIIDLADGRLAHEEVLVRMLDEDGALLSPGSFLPLAERLDLIVDIDRWVVREALRLARRGRRLEINLSAHSLGDAQLAETIAQSLGDGTDPQALVFEITETAAVENMASAESFANRLAELGCGFALDDFGMGFGSLRYLRHIPITILKIHQDFIRDLPTSAVDQRIVRNIDVMAKGLGMRTVAEGVESPEALALLRAYGVDQAQGFFIARPAEIDPTMPPQVSIEPASLAA